MAQPTDEERLKSGKAVAAALLISVILLAAVGIFVAVLFAKGCQHERAPRTAAACAVRDPSLRSG
jgi:hypothetical protein